MFGQKAYIGSNVMETDCFNVKSFCQLVNCQKLIFLNLVTSQFLCLFSLWYLLYVFSNLIPLIPILLDYLTGLIKMHNVELAFLLQEFMKAVFISSYRAVSIHFFPRLAAS